MREDDFELDNRVRLAKEIVPWIRRGWPSSLEPGHPLGPNLWGPYVLNIGVASHRLYPDEWMIKYKDPSGVYERAFAECWDYENNASYGRSPYDMFFYDLSKIGLIKNEHDDKLMQYTLQAFAQWLGTNCGAGFIRSAEQLGKREHTRINELITPGYIEKQQRYFEEEKRILQSIEKEREESRKKEIEKLAAEKFERMVEQEIEIRVRQRLEEEVEKEIKRRINERKSYRNNSRMLDI